MKFTIKGKIKIQVEKNKYDLIEKRVIKNISNFRKATYLNNNN
jgi:hypothetical protein